jgi:hypothetical protein
VIIWHPTLSTSEMRSLFILLLATAATVAANDNTDSSADGVASSDDVAVSSSGSDSGSGSSGAPTNGVEKCSMSIRGKD